MNPMLQRHCAKFIYIVPDGLRELMSDISREVIRTQPEQIYTYIADYLDALMITRENARIAAKMVDSISEIAETTVEILLRIGLSRAEADVIVGIIQTTLRDYLDRQKKPKAEFMYEESEAGEDMTEEEVFTQRILNQLNISMDKLQHMVIIIQTAWRKFKDRQKREKQLLFGMVDWRIAAKSAIMLYRKTGVTKYEANRAATLIKAAYKGYYTRRIMRRLLSRGLDDDEPTTTQEEELTSEQVGEIETEMPSYLEDYAAEEETPRELSIKSSEDAVEHVPDAHLHTPVHYAEGETATVEEDAVAGEEQKSVVGEMVHEEAAGDVTEESEGNAPPPNTENMTEAVETDAVATTEAEDLPPDETADSPEANDTAEPAEDDQPASDADTDTENATETATTDATTDETEDEA